MEEQQEHQEEQQEQQEQQEQGQAPDLNTLIEEVKSDYEKRITDLLTKHDKEIKERDNVIKQLLRGETCEEPHTIADTINATRNFKKW